MTDKNELPDGGLSKSTAKRVTALAAASVSERARISVAIELITNIKRSCQRGRNVADPIKDKSYVESCDHIEDLAQQAIRQIEILSNRPSESTVQRLRDAIEGECDGLGITEESAESILRYIGFHPQGRIVGGREIDGVWVIEATFHSDLMPNQQLVRYEDYRRAIEQALTQQRDTTHQPSASVMEPGALRALVTAANAVLAENPADDGMWTLEQAVRPFNATMPAECANGCPTNQVCDYCQYAPQPSADAVRELVKRWRGSGKDWYSNDFDIRGSERRKCADELESLLSGGSHA